MDKARQQITGHTRIRDVMHLGKDGSVVVRDNATIDEVARTVAADPWSRVVAVVNEKGTLVGVIPLDAVLNEVFMHILPEEFLADIVDLDTLLDYTKMTAARVAKDIMQPPVSVTADETVRDAFRRMHKHRLGGIPVVDEAGNVLASVDMLELLQCWLKSRGELPPTNKT